VLDPGQIVLGGPVAALFPQVEREVLDSIGQHLAQPFVLPAIEVSALGAEACAYGGAMVLHHRLLSIDERLVYGGGIDSA
jgi:predicted NBD/HSP70 family sugar kinase